MSMNLTSVAKRNQNRFPFQITIITALTIVMISFINTVLAKELANDRQMLRQSSNSQLTAASAASQPTGVQQWSHHVHHHQHQHQYQPHHHHQTHSQHHQRHSSGAGWHRGSPAISQSAQQQRTVPSRRHKLKKREYYTHCKGVYDMSIYAKIDRICEDCFNLFREPQLHSLCRQNCFKSTIFKGCVDTLLLSNDTQQLMEWVKQLNGADPLV